MARVLSLALAASLVALSNGQITQFFPRADADPTDIRICRAPGWQNDLVARFTGIFFGDFYTGGGEDIYGSLAVKGNFHAPNYVVNLKHGAICEEVNSFNSYGLVVGGITDTFNTHVHGSAYLKQGGTVEEVLELDSGCVVTQDYETGIFNFDEVENLLLTTSKQLAAMTPTSILESDSSLTLLRNTHPDYEVLTFHSCAQSVCSSDADTESSTAHLTGVTGFWNGVEGPNQPDYDKTYVFNIPVTNGGTIKFTVNNPSNSFNACKLVYNFYPVDKSGKYVENGDFTLIRQTANDMAGFVLAPRGHIVDGTEGNFAGNVVGLDYTWLDLNNGVEIKDYEDNGDCDQYIGCLPIHQHTDHTTVILTLPTTTASRTKTWSTTQNTLSDMMNTEDPVTYSEDTEEEVSTITLTDCPYDDTIVVTSTTTVEDTDYVVTTRQVTRSSFTTETTTIDGPTVIETDGDVTVTELTTTTEFETEYVEVVETYTDYEIIDGTTHLIEATTTTTVILLEPVTKSECDMRTRTYYTGCETVNTCSGTECIESSEMESSSIVTSDESSIVTSEESSEEEVTHTWDHSHKHKHKHKYNKHKGHHHGKDEECNEGGDDDDEDDDDDDEEDWDKDEDDKDDDDDEDDDDDKEWEGKDDDDDDWEDKHKGHHHGKDEECNEE